MRYAFVVIPQHYESLSRASPSQETILHLNKATKTTRGCHSAEWTPNSGEWVVLSLGTSLNPSGNGECEIFGRRKCYSSKWANGSVEWLKKCQEPSLNLLETPKQLPFGWISVDSAEWPTDSGEWPLNYCFRFLRKLKTWSTFRAFIPLVTRLYISHFVNEMFTPTLRHSLST